MARAVVGDVSAVAERALGFAGPEAQVTVIRERSLLSRYARSEPTQATAVDDTTVEILVVRDGHPAVATTNGLDDEALQIACARAAAAALASARSGPGPYPGLASPAPVTPVAGCDPETAALDAGVAGAALRDAFAVAAAHGLEAFGVWTVGDVRTAIVSTTGLALEEEVTDAFMKVVCRDDAGRSGYALGTAVAASALDPAQLAERAASKVSGAPLAELGPGTYPVVLEPEAVGLLLEFLGSLAFNGLVHAEERGALSGRLGSAVAAPCVGISDCARAAGTLPRSFDFEGVPKQDVTLVEGGVARGVVHDQRSAAIAPGDARSTGHALAPGGSPWGPGATNLVMEAGGAAGARALAAPIERGIYVTRLWYVNTVREKETLLTGMTRDGTFLIEDGEISRPLRDVRFTDSVLRLLSATEELTSERRLVSEGEFYGRRFASGVLCPGLRAGGFRLTGGGGSPGRSGENSS